MKRLVAAAVICLLASSALGQSLGEIARKERERRKKNRAQGRSVQTLTDADVAPPPAARGPTPQPKAGADGGTPEIITSSIGNPDVTAPTWPATRMAPGFTLYDRRGSRVSLADYRGRPVLLDFWATWCGPCRQTMPELERFHRKYRRRDLQVIGINIEGKSEEVLDYLKRGGYSFRVLFDEGNWESEVARRYGVSSIPRTFLIDRSGNIVFSGHPQRLSESQIEAALE